MTEFQIRTRNYIFRFMVLIAFVVLFGQLWNLQVVQGETYRELADANRFRLTQVPASRGVIYDRNGELLVRNRPVYNVVIIPAFLPEDDTARAKVFARLSELLNLPITTQIDPIGGRNNGYFNAINHHQYNRVIQRQIVNPRSRRFANEPLGIRDAVDQSSVFAPFLPLEIATDVDPMIVARIEEERLDLPGALVDIAPSREYLYGELTSHMLGYTGPIPAERFEAYEAQGYALTDKIGLAGLEIQYEDRLRGIKGLESIEVDVTGQKIRTVSQNIQVQPGHNLRLTLDLELQQVTAEALQAQMDEVGSRQGVAIALNPQNGEILAMVSLPSYDNNLFSRGISPRELSLLSEDPQTPLVDHAIAGLYPPGSIFKIIPASGALQERTILPETTIFDEGILYLPNQFAPDNLDLAQPFFCWLRSGHGLVNLVSGLAWSCNVYFHYIGGGYDPINYEGLGLERMGKYAQMYGLGTATGIDLPGELDGLVPDQKWKRINYAETWLTGDTYNMAIGQGFVLVTPLQMVNAYAAIANGGTLYRPHLVKEILDADDNVVEVIKPEAIGRLALDPQNLQLVRQGLHGVINWDTGTAHEFFDVPGIDASGKTGTAEFCDSYPQCLDRDGRVRTSHAWFAAYAPTNNPEIVTIVFIYGGKQGAGIAVQGSEVAVPVTNQIMRYYFNIQDEEEPEEETEETEELPPGLQPETKLTGRFLGTDSWYQENVGLAGFVLDEQGNGVTNVRLEIVSRGATVAEFSSGEAGRFEYNASKFEDTETWQIRLPDYPQSQQVQLEVAHGFRYLIEFQAQPPEETDPLVDLN
jgi:penicillin-binding protein 2